MTGREYLVKEKNCHVNTGKGAMVRTVRLVLVRNPLMTGVSNQASSQPCEDGRSGTISLKSIYTNFPSSKVAREYSRLCLVRERCVIKSIRF